MPGHYSDNLCLVLLHDSIDLVPIHLLSEPRNSDKRSNPARKVTVRAYLKVYKEIFVAKDTIQRDKVIEETDLVRVRRNVDRTTADYVTEPQDLVGKIATRTINPKEVIQERTVATPPLVNTGDRLMIVYETPLLRLTAPGISMSKGRMGEKIPVRNADSKLVVYATVQDENTVQVQ